MKNGRYDVSSGHSRFEAVDRYKARGGNLRSIKGVCLIKGRGNQRVFKYPFGEQVIGGLGDGRPDSAFDPVQLKKGIKVEMEHTNNPRVAKEIAKDHLTEHRDYYKALAKMERKLEKKK